MRLPRPKLFRKRKIKKERTGLFSLWQSFFALLTCCTSSNANKQQKRRRRNKVDVVVCPSESSMKEIKVTADQTSKLAKETKQATVPLDSEKKKKKKNRRVRRRSMSEEKVEVEPGVNVVEFDKVVSQKEVSVDKVAVEDRGRESEDQGCKSEDREFKSKVKIDKDNSVESSTGSATWLAPERPTDTKMEIETHKADSKATSGNNHVGTEGNQVSAVTEKKINVIAEDVKDNTCSINDDNKVIDNAVGTETEIINHNGNDKEKIEGKEINSEIAMELSCAEVSENKVLDTDQKMLTKKKDDQQKMTAAINKENGNKDSVLIEKCSINLQSVEVFNETVSLKENNLVTDFVQDVLSRAMVDLQMEDGRDKDMVCQQKSTGRFDGAVPHVAESMNLNTDAVVGTERSSVISQSIKHLNETDLNKENNLITGFVQGVLSQAALQLQMEYALDQDAACKSESVESFEGGIPQNLGSMNLNKNHDFAKTNLPTKKDYICLASKSLCMDEVADIIPVTKKPLRKVGVCKDEKRSGIRQKSPIRRQPKPPHRYFRLNDTYESLIMSVKTEEDFKADKVLYTIHEDEELECDETTSVSSCDKPEADDSGVIINREWSLTVCRSDVLCVIPEINEEEIEEETTVVNFILDEVTDENLLAVLRMQRQKYIEGRFPTVAIMDVIVEEEEIEDDDDADADVGENGEMDSDDENEEKDNEDSREGGAVLDKSDEKKGDMEEDGEDEVTNDSKEQIKVDQVVVSPHDDMVIEENVMGESVIKESAMEESVIDEVVMKKSVTEEGVMEGKVMEGSANEESVVEESAIGTPPQSF